MEESLYGAVKLIAEQEIIKQCRAHYNQKHNEVPTAKEIEDLYLSRSEIQKKITKKQIQILIECFEEFLFIDKISFSWKLTTSNKTMFLILTLAMLIVLYICNIYIPNIILKMQKIIFKIYA